MDEEYDALIKLFDLNPEEKEKRLTEIFKLSTKFIEKYKHIQADGDEEQKRDMKAKLGIIKEKIAIETAASQKKLGLSKDEIRNLAENKENFTEEQWEMLQQTKKTIEEERKKIKQKQKAAIERELPKKSATNKVKKKRKSKRGKSSWLKS